MPSPTRPPIFQASTFAEANALASARELWLLVSVTAPTDAACGTMDDRSWRSPDVCASIEGRALAVQVSVPADREVARTLNVRAVPTSIAFKAGREEDRFVGFREPSELSKWLDTLEARTTTPDFGLRESSAKMLLDDQRYDDATSGYVWLWNNIPGAVGAHETGLMGVRRTGLAAELKSLVAVHPLARAAFSAIRDASAAAAPALDLGDWFGPRVDWLVLNRSLGEEERTLAWFDRVKSDSRHARVLDHVAKLLLEPLKQRQRWADIGLLFSDPLARLSEAHEFVRLMAQRTPSFSALDRHVDRRFREEAVVLYAGLRAAGRTSDAKAVRAEALRLDPTDEMRLALDRAPVPYH